MRTIQNVECYTRSTGEKRCKVTVADDQGREAVVALHSLTRPEAQAAAKMVYPTIPANVWLRFSAADLQNIIRENDVAKAQAAVDAKKAEPKAPKAPEPQPETPEAEATPEAPTPEPTPQPEQAKTAAEKLAEVLAELSPKTTLDPDQIRAVVAEEVAKVADDIRVVRVNVTLPDRTVDLPELHHKDLPKLIAKVAAGVNVFIVGPAGTGKSVAAGQVAKALDKDFQSISFGPTTPTSKLFGYMTPDGQFVETPLYRAYRGNDGKGGLFLGDELDNGHPGLLAEQNQFLANGHCAFACGMVEKAEGFAYIATGNTFGRGGDRLFVGRNQLDAATLDRFVFHVLDIDEDLEYKAAMRFSTNDSAAACREWIETVRRVRAVVADQKLPIVVSPRSSIDGCKLITTGAFTKAEVVEDCLLKGVSGDTRQKLGV